MADPVSIGLSLAQLIVPPVEPVIRRLIEERRERKQMEKGLEKEIQRLFSNMEALKDLLHDADKKQYQSAPLRTWLMKLKEVVSYADDVLDEYATDLAISQMEGGLQLLNPDGWRVKSLLAGKFTYNQIKGNNIKALVTLTYKSCGYCYFRCCCRLHHEPTWNADCIYL